MGCAPQHRQAGNDQNGNNQVTEVHLTDQVADALSDQQAEGDRHRGESGINQQTLVKKTELVKRQCPGHDGTDIEKTD